MAFKTVEDLHEDTTRPAVQRTLTVVCDLEMASLLGMLTGVTQQAQGQVLHAIEITDAKIDPGPPAQVYVVFRWTEAG